MAFEFSFVSCYFADVCVCVCVCSMSVQERELIGRLCKRLIDEGRLCYLRGRGLEAELSCYTRTDISMENVLLTAVTRSGHTGATHAP